MTAEQRTLFYTHTHWFAMEEVTFSTKSSKLILQSINSIFKFDGPSLSYKAADFKVFKVLHSGTFAENMEPQTLAGVSFLYLFDVKH